MTATPQSTVAPTDPVDAAMPPKARRRRRVVLVAVLTMLLALAAVTTYVAIQSTKPPQVDYQVSVFLRDDATDAQTAAIKDALRRLKPKGAVQYMTRQQAYEKFKKMFADQPDLLRNAEPGMLPDSFVVTIVRPEQPCPDLNAVKRLAGVDQVVVARGLPKGYRPTKAEMPALMAEHTACNDR